MAMFKLNPMYSGDTQLCVVAGSYVFQNTGAATANTIVQQQLYKAPANTAGAAIGQNETIAPQGSKVPCVLNPTAAYAPQVASGGNASIALLDLNAYPGDIVCVQVGLVAAPSATAGALNVTPYDASVIAIDQTNHYVYVAGTTSAGVAQNFQSGLALHFVVYFKDTYVP